MKHIVVGGGIIGLLSAYYLRAAGEEVTVLEKSAMGNESSWAGGGILSPLYPWRYPPALSQLVSHSQSLYPELIDKLESATGIEIEYLKSGMLILDTGEHQQAQDWCHRNNVAFELIDAKVIKSIAPAINPHYIDTKAIWLPEIPQVRNPRLLKALVKYLNNNGVNLIDDTAVTKLLESDGQVVGVQTDKGNFMADNTIIACGAWSPLIISELKKKLGMEPVRGQMILIKAKSSLINPIIMLNSHYLIPRKDGRILAGSTMEYVGYQKETTDNAAQELYQRAVDLVPELKHYSIEKHWAGLRPGVLRNVPIIGAHPTLHRLFINTGHFRNGVVTAPGSANLLTDHILDKKSTLDVSAYTF